ncbi:MAG: hypothetical protein ACE15F_09940 [bacterium]
MRTKPNLKPDGEQPNLPFLDPGAVPELANLPGRDDLLRETPSREQDRALLLTLEEKTASKLLGCYTAKAPARRCHRPRQRKVKP